MDQLPPPFLRSASPDQQARPLHGPIVPRGPRIVTWSIETDELRGAINLVDTGRVVGWAQDTTEPNIRVQLEILIGGKVVASVLADRYREELYRNGVGDGMHGFEAALPARLGGTDVLEIRRADDKIVIDTWPSGIRGFALPGQWSTSNRAEDSSEPPQ